MNLSSARRSLKRDSLGGALPPHKRPFLNSFGTVSARGAERRCSRGRSCSPRPHHPNGPAHACRAAHLLPSGGCPEATSQPKGRRGLPAHARRVQTSVPSAPYNTRLELAATGGEGRIPFVGKKSRRRSSSAIR